MDRSGAGLEFLANAWTHPWARTLLGAVTLLLAAAVAAWLARVLVDRVARLVSRHAAWAWGDALARRGVFRHLARVVPMLVIRYGVLVVPGTPALAARVVGAFAATGAALFVVLACNAALSAGEDLYAATPRGREHPIKGYVQLGRILLWLIGVILIVATLVDRSALSLLAGLGAISAVLLLIFRDTILRQLRLLDGYFQRRERELTAWNARLSGDGWSGLNARRLTNLGSFRACMQAYVEAHPGINQELFRAVRQLDPGAEGIPLQVYAYTRDTGFVAHENFKGDIFDHLITILPEFGLRLFQRPTGADLRGGPAKRYARSGDPESDGSGEDRLRA